MRLPPGSRFPTPDAGAVLGVDLVPMVTAVRKGSLGPQSPNRWDFRPYGHPAQMDDSSRMELDRHGLEKLEREECLSLLAGRSVGRVGITIAALPAIFPVNFALLEGDIVFRSSPGSKLTAAAQRAIVAFEVDDTDSMFHSGWSVLVVGPAHEITDPAELARAEKLPLTPWAPGTKGHYIRIRSEIVSGRRIGMWEGSPVAKPGVSTYH